MQAGSRVVRRFVQMVWLVDPLVLVLAGLLVGATALCGLGLVSTWVSTPNPSSADGLTPGHLEAEASVFEVSGGALCCRETR